MIEKPKTVEDFASHLFNLEGFMLYEEHRGKPAVTVTFPDSEQAWKFYEGLVWLSQLIPSKAQ